MTPEREAELEAAGEYGRRMAEETLAGMQRQIDKRDEMMVLLRASESSLAASQAEVRARRRPRLVAVDGVCVDNPSPLTFG